MSIEQWIAALKHEPQGSKLFTVPCSAMPKKRWLYEGYFLSLARKWKEDNGTPYYEGYCGGTYAPTPEVALDLLQSPPEELEAALSYIRDHAPHYGRD